MPKKELWEELYTVYHYPVGNDEYEWAATCLGKVADGFHSRFAALKWITDTMAKELMERLENE